MLSQTSSMVYKMLFFPTVHFKVEDFFPTIKILTPHNFTTSKTGCNLSQAVQTVYRCVPLCKQFLFKGKSQHITFCAPWLGMQVDAECMIKMLWSENITLFSLWHIWATQVCSCQLSVSSPPCHSTLRKLMFTAAQQPTCPLSLSSSSHHAYLHHLFGALI